jgi:hypothetical protein
LIRRKISRSGIAAEYLPVTVKALAAPRANTSLHTGWPLANDCRYPWIREVRAFRIQIQRCLETDFSSSLGLDYKAIGFSAAGSFIFELTLRGTMLPGNRHAAHSRKVKRSPAGRSMLFPGR